MNAFNATQHGYCLCLLGAVGQEFLRVLKERDFPYSNIKLLASARYPIENSSYYLNHLFLSHIRLWCRSAGRTYDFDGKTYKVEELTEGRCV